MESGEFRRGFNVFRRTYEERSIADLREQRKAVFQDFARQAADAPGCDLVGDEPHIHAPHDGKVGPYAVGAAVSLLIGTQFAYYLTSEASQSHLDAAQVIAPLTDQPAPAPADAAANGLSLTFALLVALTFAGTGKIIEAAFTAVEPRTFYKRADSWYRRIIAIGLGVSCPPLLLSRVATGTVAEYLALLTPLAWLGLESTLLITGALAWAAAVRFAWSRRSVRADKRLVENIREHEQVMVGVPAVIDGGVTHAEPIES